MSPRVDLERDHCAHTAGTCSLEARPLRVVLDDRPGRACATGIGRYARTLIEALAAPLAGIEVLLLTELVPGGFSSPIEEELHLPAVLEREQVDLLHSPLFHLPAALPPRVRSVITIHDAIPAVRPELADPSFVRLWHDRVGQAGARADRIVVPSRHAAVEVAGALGLDPARLRLVPEAPAAVFAPRPPEVVAEACARFGLEPGRYLLAVGSLEPRKAPDLVLEALARLPELPDLVAAFAGPAAGFALAPAAAALELSRRVRALGLVSDEDLAALYAGALALVFPSRHEGFGLPLVEAFACGAPVVASQATSIPEVAGDAALLVPPEDPDALAAAVRRLSREPELARELGARGRERLDRCFAPAAVRQALAGLWHELQEEGA